MLALETKIKRKKGTPQVQGEFCPFTLKIKVATLEQAAALRAIAGSMRSGIAARIAQEVLYYPTTSEAVTKAARHGLGSIHAELTKQGIPSGSC